VIHFPGLSAQTIGKTRVHHFSAVRASPGTAASIAARTAATSQHCEQISLPFQAAWPSNPQARHSYRAIHSSPAPAPIMASAAAPVWPTSANLSRVNPAQNAFRFYRLEVWPDLFGRALLLRHWGRIGTEGRCRLDPHPDPEAAGEALAQLARAKRRRGYQDRA
jgi:predicted DNA-binding WGR domain protein